MKKLFLFTSISFIIILLSANIQATSLLINLENASINNIPFNSFLYKSKMIENDWMEKDSEGVRINLKKTFLAMMDKINGVLSTYINDGAYAYKPSWGGCPHILWKDEGLDFSLVINGSVVYFGMHIYLNKYTDNLPRIGKVTYSPFSGNISWNINKNTRREFFEATLGKPYSWSIEEKGGTVSEELMYNSIDSETGKKILTAEDAIDIFKIKEQKFSNICINYVAYKKNGFKYRFNFNVENGKLECIDIYLDD